MSFDLEFSSEDMKEKEFNFFKQGVHKVQITTVKFDKTEDAEAKPFVEVGVVSPDDSELTDTARFWFNSEPARNYSLNIIRGIFVHNAAEDKKDEVKAKFNALKSASELEKAMNKMLPGKEAWFTVYPSDTRTYKNSSGKTLPSLDKNLYGYEPAEKKVAATPDKVSGTVEGGEPVDPSESPFGF